MTISSFTGSFLKKKVSELLPTFLILLFVVWLPVLIMHTDGLAGPVGSSLGEAGFSDEVQTAGDALANELAAAATRGESVRGASGAMGELAINSGELICAAWIIRFKLQIDKMVVESNHMEGDKLTKQLELIRKAENFRCKLYRECVKQGFIEKGGGGVTAGGGGVPGETPEDEEVEEPSGYGPGAVPWADRPTGWTVGDEICLKHCRGPYRKYRDLVWEAVKAKSGADSLQKKLCELGEKVREAEERVKELEKIAGEKQPVIDGKTSEREQSEALDKILKIQKVQQHHLPAARGRAQRASDHYQQVKNWAESAVKDAAAAWEKVEEARKAYEKCLEDCIEKSRRYDKEGEKAGKVRDMFPRHRDDRPPASRQNYGYHPGKTMWKGCGAVTEGFLLTPPTGTEPVSMGSDPVFIYDRSGYCRLWGGWITYYPEGPGTVSPPCVPPPEKRPGPVTSPPTVKHPEGKPPSTSIDVPAESEKRPPPKKPSTQPPEHNIKAGRTVLTKNGGIKMRPLAKVRVKIKKNPPPPLPVAGNEGTRDEDRDASEGPDIYVTGNDGETRFIRPSGKPGTVISNPPRLAMATHENAAGRIVSDAEATDPSRGAYMVALKPKSQVKTIEILIPDFKSYIVKVKINRELSNWDDPAAYLRNKGLKRFIMRKWIVKDSMYIVLNIPAVEEE